MPWGGAAGGRSARTRVVVWLVTASQQEQQSALVAVALQPRYVQMAAGGFHVAEASDEEG